MSGDLEAVELHSRAQCYLRVSQIAAVMVLKEGGPARVLFSGGGHIDVCGSAEVWRLKIRILELTALEGEK